MGKMVGMAQFKVVSNRLVGHTQGSLVSEAELDGANIAALIEAGHIAEIGSKPSKSKDTKEQE
jgi:hypothetical protein